MSRGVRGGGGARGGGGEGEGAEIGEIRTRRRRKGGDDGGGRLGRGGEGREIGERRKGEGDWGEAERGRETEEGRRLGRLTSRRLSGAISRGKGERGPLRPRTAVLPAPPLRLFHPSSRLHCFSLPHPSCIVSLRCFSRLFPSLSPCVRCFPLTLFFSFLVPVQRTLVFPPARSFVFCGVAGRR